MAHRAFRNLLAKIYPATLGVIGTAAAVANFTGNWNGPGVFNVNGSAVPCKRISYPLKQSSNRIEVSTYQIECGDSIQNGHPYAVDVRDNTLVYRGEAIGSISDREIRAQFNTENGSSVLFEAILENDVVMKAREMVVDRFGAVREWKATLTRE